MSTTTVKVSSTRRFKVPANFGKRTTMPEVVVVPPLSAEEKHELQKCEATIQRGLQTFREVGEALFTIRDHRLYRATHGTFEAYCREKWEFSKTQANRLIGAAEVVGNLEAAHLIKPNTVRESQVRALVGAPPAKQKELWKRVLAKAGDAEHVTAAIVNRVVSPSKKGATRTKARQTVTKAAVIQRITAEFTTHPTWPKDIKTALIAVIKKL